MADPLSEPEQAGQDRDHRIVRRIRWIFGAGFGLGFALAVAAAVGAGVSGRGGLAIVLLASAAGSATAALYGTATVLYDDLKGQHRSRHRIAWSVGLFAAAAFLLAMAAGTLGG